MTTNARLAQELNKARDTKAKLQTNVQTQEVKLQPFRSGKIRMSLFVLLGAPFLHRKRKKRECRTNKSIN